MRLLLGSTSRYRRELLERFGLPFETARPRTDETPRPGEAPAELAARLALAKAENVSSANPDAWVLGSDQVAELDGSPIGKSAGRDAAISQLLAMSGREVHFHTGLALARAGQPTQVHRDRTTVRFRRLTAAEVARYVDAEQPFDCAGSFKAEGLGITLFEAIESVDPTALIGLPLIATARLLRGAGFQLP